MWCERLVRYRGGSKADEMGDDPRHSCSFLAGAACCAHVRQCLQRLPHYSRTVTNIQKRFQRLNQAAILHTKIPHSHIGPSYKQALVLVHIPLVYVPPSKPDPHGM